MRIRLGDVATYVNGYAFKPSDRGQEGLPIVRIQDLTGNSYDLAYYNGDYPERIEINNGDVLISWSASLGVFVWDRGKALLNQHIFKVVFGDVEIDRDFFVYAVQHRLSDMGRQTHGATMKHIVKSDFENIEIPYLPLCEQTRVSGVLRSAQAAIALRMGQLDLLDELVKARFVEMFGDPIENPKQLPVRRIDAIADVQTGATPLRSNPAYYGGSIPWVKTGEVASGLLEEAEETITSLALQETNCKLFPAGTILVAMYGQGDTRGKAGILRQAAATNQACAAILLNEGYDADFILSQLNLRYEDLRSRSLGGNQQNLSLKIVRAYELIVPPIERQNAFMAFVREVDKLKAG